MASDQNSNDLYIYAKNLHNSEPFRELVADLDYEGLVPKLRKYQEDAVRWMIYKEKRLDEEYLPKELNGIPVVYPRGGILADEMGLGKTVETLALILNHKFKGEETKEKLEIPVVKMEAKNEWEGADSKGKEEIYDLQDIQEEVEIGNEESNDADLVKREPLSCEAVPSRRKRKPNVSTQYHRSDSEDELEADSSGSDYVPETKKTRNRRKPRKSENESDSNSDYEPPRKKSVYTLSQTSQKKKKYVRGSNYKYLSAWYEQVLSEMSSVQRNREREEREVKCVCSSLSRKRTVKCPGCGTRQHRACMGLEGNPSPNYHCFDCWPNLPPIPSRATFLVSPDSIVHQWHEEILRHVKEDKLKVLFYEGSKNGRFVQPEELADQDIVITTYSVMRAEVVYCGGGEERRLRHAKVWRAARSPLPCIVWWRLCLDEAQMVEGAASKAAAMVRGLHAVNKWAITGTPIQRSINDLWGLMQFLGCSPLTEQSVWRQVSGDPALLHSTIAPLLWRSFKADVLEMLGVPPQTCLTHWLKFSPVELYFYNRTHNECSTNFRNRLNRFEDWEVPLARLDKSLVNRLLIPLLRLRQACTHPQAVRGKFMQFKKTMTMEELLVEMVGRVKNDIDVAVRSHVACLNGQAGIRLLLGEWSQAIQLYREVLQLPNNYPKGTIKVDPLQRLHTLHNLAEVLQEPLACVAPTLRDANLAEEALAAEQDYLKKHLNMIGKEKAVCEKWGGEVDRLSAGRPVGFSPWWEQLVITCDDPKELMEKVHSLRLDADDKVLNSKKNYYQRIKSIQGLVGEMAMFLADSFEDREKIIKELKKLGRADPSSLCLMSTSCHIGDQAQQNTKKSSKSRCSVCRVEDLLLSYETKIFEVKQNVNERKANANIREEWEEGGEGEGEGSKAVANLQLDKVVLKAKSQGNWRPSRMITLLHVLLSYAKSKKCQHVEIQEAVDHLAYLDALCREFKSLRAYWKSISDHVLAYDELAMAKLRFRLPTADELKSSNKNKLKDRFIITEHMVGDELEKLMDESVFSERDIGKHMGIMTYLQNLQRTPSSERDPCPICRDALSDKWSVLECGHCYCFDCIPHLLGSGSSNQVECAVCRKRTSVEGVAYVDCQSSHPSTDHTVRGSPSTKVEAIILQILRIKAEHSTDKIIIFSTWEKVLEVICEALELNSITFRRLRGSKSKWKQMFHEFKRDPLVSVLLMPLKAGSKGLNLVEATHVFLVEPILNPAEELQAVGRVHRIGQTRETFVHKFAIRCTIEEQMMRALDARGEEWSDSNITLNMLQKLFNLSSVPNPTPAPTSSQGAIDDPIIL